MKKILLYKCPPIIKQTFCLFNYELIEVEYPNETLGYLLELDGYQSSKFCNCVSINESIMIFYNLDDTDIDNILKILKLNSINVDYKAVVTPYNINWTLAYLYNELVKERNAINKNS